MFVSEQSTKAVLVLQLPVLQADQVIIICQYSLVFVTKGFYFAVTQNVAASQSGESSAVDPKCSCAG